MKKKKQKKQPPTHRPSLDELDAQPTKPLDRAKSGSGALVTLLVQHGGQVHVVELSLGSSIDIGRSRKAGLTIDDEALSRVHARFEVSSDGILWVEDLDSMNGTWVGSLRADRAPLRPRSVATLGNVRVVVDRLRSTDSGALELWDHGRLVDHLQQEIIRGRDFDHDVALLMIRRPTVPRSVEPWYPELGHLLRPSDRLGVFAEDTLEVILPQRAFDQAHELARLVRSEVSAGDELFCAVGVFPESASSADELVAATFAALRAASADAPIAAASRSVDRALQSTLERHLAADNHFVAVSPAMRSIEESLERLVDWRLPVLIVGETGVGKEVVAKALHVRSDRAKKPLICINCGAIPDPLLESTLFGHERGAFTGAHARRRGAFEEAGAGTVFLDEVGELSERAQVALLRVIEANVVARIGSSQEHPIKAHLIVATNRDLEEMVEAGTFRRDLLYRLNAVVVEVPPLRQRRDDIIPLARLFAARACEQQQRQRPRKKLAQAARDALCAYHWPGNVRELRNVIERAVAIGGGEEISLTDLPRKLWSSSAQRPPPVGAVEPRTTKIRETLQEAERALLFEALERAGWNRAAAALAVDLPQRTLAHKIRALQIQEGGSYDRSLLRSAALAGPGGIRARLKKLEAALIREALDACDGNKSAAARRLGLSRSAFLDRLSKAGR